eukprot:111957_1
MSFRCQACLEQKPRSAFTRSQLKNNKHNSRCRKCIQHGKNKKKKQYLIRHKINQVKTWNIVQIKLLNVDEYPPTITSANKYEPRLCDIFGTPFRNKLLTKNKKNSWSIDNLLHSHITLKFINEKNVRRGFSLNQTNGFIAILSLCHISVYAPVCSWKFALIARYTFTKKQQLYHVDHQYSRIRYVHNLIFIWSYSKCIIYVFKLKENSIVLDYIMHDKYFKESETVDIAIMDDLLIILFDRWCGIYKLYPTLEWYHAVAFSPKSVASSSLEICNVPNCEQTDNGEFYKSTNKHYIFINAGNQLIGIHPTCPIYAGFHIAENVENGKCNFCISEQYGVFYLSNDRKMLYQSGHLNKMSVQKIIDLAIGTSEKQIIKFYNLDYDEGYGISGRLLLLCENNKNKYSMYQMFNRDEIIPLFRELVRVKTTGRESFNLISCVYQMLYGDDIIYMVQNFSFGNTYRKCDECKAINSDLVELRLCKKCQAVYYCSKRCQKTAWKLKHRYYCFN